MRNAINTFIVLLIIAADQISKWAVMELLLRPSFGDAGPSSGFVEWITGFPNALPFTEIPVLPFFNMVMVWNKGISFGLFNHDTDYGPLILIALSIVIGLWFYIWMLISDSRMQNWGLALVVGGAVGNMLDRIRFGAVIDFLDFHIAGIHWPAFNVADSAIVIGVFILMIYAFFFQKTLHHQPVDH